MRPQLTQHLWKSHFWLVRRCEKQGTVTAQKQTSWGTETKTKNTEQTKPKQNKCLFSAEWSQRSAVRFKVKLRLIKKKFLLPTKIEVVACYCVCVCACAYMWCVKDWREWRWFQQKPLKLIFYHILWSGLHKVRLFLSLHVEELVWSRG